MSSDTEEKKSLLSSINAHESYESSGNTYQPSSYVSVAQSNKRRRNTIWVLYFTMFIGSISFSIVMSSLWPFLRKLDHKISEEFMGYINAGYSLAQMLSGVLFGYWTDRRNPMEPLITSVVCMIVGSGLYAYAEPFGQAGVWVLFGARVLLGLSAGSVSVARSVGAHLSTPEDRGKIMAYLALWQAIGFFIGPALQALSKVAGTDGVYVSSLELYFNIYTAPSYLMILLSIINVVLLVFYFRYDSEHKEKFHKEQKKIRRMSSTYEEVDLTAIIVCNFLWFIAMLIFSLNETIMSPILMNEFAWSRDHTVFYGGIILSAAGVLAIFCFVLTEKCIKKFGSRSVSLFGYLLMLIGFIIYLPWGPGKIKLHQVALNYPNGTSIPVESGGGGCPSTYDWCRTQPAIPFAQWLTAATIVGIGYPVAVVVLSVMYSVIIGPFPQGKYMGWLTGVGCLARVCGPLIVTAIYEHHGLRWTSTMVDILLVLTLIIFTIYWQRLVPYGQRKQVNNLSFPDAIDA